MSGEASLIARDAAPAAGAQPLSLALDAGLICLVGPERLQLSAYLHMLAGVTPCAAGELRLLGRPIAGPGSRDWQVLRRRVGLVTPQAPLLSIMSGLRNVMLPALYHRIAQEDEVERRVRALLDELEYDADHSVLPAYMSELQRRHLLIARALILEPRLLLINGPVDGLDAAAQAQLRDYITGAVCRRVPLVLVADSDPLLAQRADAVLFVGERLARLYADWGALLHTDEPEVQAYLRWERQRCAALE